MRYTTLSPRLILGHVGPIEYRSPEGTAPAAFLEPHVETQAGSGRSPQFRIHSAMGYCRSQSPGLSGCTVVFYSQTPHAPQTQSGGAEIHSESIPGAGLARREVDYSSSRLARIAYPPALDALRYVPFVMEPQTSSISDRRVFPRQCACRCPVHRRSSKRRKNHRTCSSMPSRQYVRSTTTVNATVIGECTVDETQELRVSANLQELSSFPRTL